LNTWSFHHDGPHQCPVVEQVLLTLLLHMRSIPVF